MLKEKLLDDLKNSMKEKNVIRKNVIQMVRAAILQVEKDKQIAISWFIWSSKSCLPLFS